SLAFSLSPGQAGDAPAGRALLHALPPLPARCHLVMDRAYEGNETRQLALDLGLDPVVPPHPLRAQPWAYNTEIYKRRNEIERLFRRLKGFRRIFSRFDKLDVMFIVFIHFALIVEALRPTVDSQCEQATGEQPAPRATLGWTWERGWRSSTSTTAAKMVKRLAIVESGSCPSHQRRGYDGSTPSSLQCRLPDLLWKSGLSA